MSQPTPLMPHATASWLVDNTALTFEQIAEFCGLHMLEVQAMADDLASSKYTGRDPVRAGELTMEEIETGQGNPDYKLRMHKAPVTVSRTKGPRYTPVSKRQDKPDGIAWILRNHPEVSDAQIGKLIGTTRNTITAIRERSHWNIQNINAKDPVTLGLCSQRELDAMVAKAAKKAGLEEDTSARETRLGNDAADDAERVRHLRRHLADLVVLRQQQVGEEGRVVVEGGGEVANHGLDLAAEARRGGLHRLHRRAERRILVGEQAPGEILLAGEVAVERALGHGGGAGDVADRGLGDALLDEEPEGFVGDSLAGSGAVAHGGDSRLTFGPILRERSFT